VNCNLLYARGLVCRARLALPLSDPDSDSDSEVDQMDFLIKLKLFKYACMHAFTCMHVHAVFSPDH
jgi:hypothetical protein